MKYNPTPGAPLENKLIADAINSKPTVQTITLASGANTITHNLGFRPRGRIIVWASSAATIYDTSGSNSFTASYWYVTTSAAVTVGIIWVE